MDKSKKNINIYLYAYIHTPMDRHIFTYTHYVLCKSDSAFWH